MGVPRPLAVLLCALFLPVTPLLHGQNAECRERSFIANVLDHGIVPTGLAKDDFQITYRGRSLTPRSVAYSAGPRRIMVLLDASGSMGNDEGNATKWNVARIVAWNLTAALPAGSRVGVSTFSTKNQLEVPLSPNRNLVADWLNSDKARNVDLLKGRTALYDALESALDQLHPAEPGDAIYLITDGGENASEVRRSKFQRALRDSEVRLFTVMLPPQRYTPPEEIADREGLASLSNNSGGSVDWLDAEHGARVLDEHLKEKLRIHGAQLSSQISAFYSLSVVLPENPEKAKHWELTLLESGKRKKGTWIGYPHEIPTCQTRVAQR